MLEDKHKRYFKDHFSEITLALITVFLDRIFSFIIICQMWISLFRGVSYRGLPACLYFLFSIFARRHIDKILFPELEDK